MFTFLSKRKVVYAKNLDVESVGSAGNKCDYYFIFSRGRRSMNLTLRSLTLYIYGAPILDVSRSHTTTQHSR